MNDWREFMILSSDGAWIETVTGLAAAREYRDFLQSSVCHPYKGRGERLRIKARETLA